MRCSSYFANLCENFIALQLLWVKCKPNPQGRLFFVSASAGDEALTTRSRRVKQTRAHQN